ncbi:MAG: glycosyltransferase family 2 protein [Acetobacteraceae bacterium]|nr:glycosyltransferase family 2 protein [Acetobacteraceae bacterium]
MPRVTIIVPTFNRPVFVQSTVRQLLDQSYRDVELWVIDQSGPEAATSNRAFVAACGDERLQYVHLTRAGLPNARNVGLARARGEIVVFTDDDVILLSPDFIEAHVRCFDDPRVGGVVGRHLERFIGENSRKTACHVDWSGRTIFNLRGTERQEIGSCKGSNMSFRMSAIAEIGGFDRRTHLLEDTDFSVRIAKAGWKLVFEPAAEVVHLSAPAGGVRAAPGLATEAQRFRSTAYFVAKHRGLPGLLGFGLGFSAIALVRAVRFRSVGTLPVLARAAWDGYQEARLVPDQAIESPAVAQPV